MALMVFTGWVYRIGDFQVKRKSSTRGTVEPVRRSRGLNQGRKMSVTKKKTYYDHAKEASKPIAERKETITGRNGQKRAVRRHHMSMKIQTEFLQQMQESGKMPSPYKRYTSYWGVTSALSDLGENQWHSPADILKAMEARMSHEDSKDKRGKTAWDRFKGRKARSKDRGLDYVGRLIQNLNVLQRLGGDDPYALKLAQLGACIDIRPTDKKMPQAMLRTGITKGDPVIPINEMKKRKCTRSIESVPSQICFLDTDNQSVPVNDARADDTADEPVEVVSGSY